MSASTLSTKLVTKRRDKRLFSQESIAFYLFASPWLLGLLCLTIGPIIASFVLSFADYPVITPAKWAGLANYTKLFTQSLDQKREKASAIDGPDGGESLDQASNKTWIGRIGEEF